MQGRATNIGWQQFALYQPTIGRFIWCHSDLSLLSKIQFFSNSRIFTIIYDLTTAKNWTPTLIDIDNCLEWSPCPIGRAEMHLAYSKATEINLEMLIKHETQPTHLQKELYWFRTVEKVLEILRSKNYSTTNLGFDLKLIQDTYYRLETLLPEIPPLKYIDTMKKIERELLLTFDTDAMIANIRALLENDPVLSEYAKMITTESLPHD